LALGRAFANGNAAVNGNSRIYLFLLDICKDNSRIYLFLLISPIITGSC
jgi:hypothetical protein